MFALPKDGGPHCKQLIFKQDWRGPWVPCQSGRVAAEDFNHACQKQLALFFPKFFE